MYTTQIPANDQGFLEIRLTPIILYNTKHIADNKKIFHAFLFNRNYSPEVSSGVEYYLTEDE